MVACANFCSGYKVVFAHSLLTMGHSTRHAGGFFEICPLRNERLGLRASFLSAVSCTIIMTTDQHRRDPFRFRGVLHKDAIQFASTCALKVRLLGRYSSHLWERWIGPALSGFLVHVGSSVAVAFCTFSEALRPMVGAEVLRRFVGRWSRPELCVLFVCGRIQHV